MQGSRRNILKIVLILLIVALLSMGITALIYSFVNVIDIREIDMELRVGSRIGINLDTDKLWFGGVFPGGTATRTMKIANERDFPIKVQFVSAGQLKDYVHVQPPVIIAPGTMIEVQVNAFAPLNMPHDTYTGKMRIIIKRVT